MAEKRQLSDLRVVDLKLELEKRGMDKIGNKATLVERLSEALTNEGYDPQTYEFSITDATAPKRTSTAKRQLRNKEGDPDHEGDEDEDEAESGDSILNDSTHEESAVDDKPTPIATDQLSTSNSASAASLSDTALFKLPPLQDVEPRYQFTVDETVKLHDNRPAGDDTSSSIFVNTGDGNISKVDQGENTNGDSDKASIKNELIDENEDLPAVVTTPGAGDSSELSQSTIIKNEPMEGVNAVSSAPIDLASLDPTGASAAVAAPSTDDDVQRDDAIKPAETTKSESEKPTEKASKGNELWITGLAPNTRAAEIKTVFTKYGRVIVAKIVQALNAKNPGSKCFGLASMATPEEASKCIQHLHRTEFHGRMITVGRATEEQIALSMGNKGAQKTLPTAASAVKTGNVVKKPNAAAITKAASLQAKKPEPPKTMDDGQKMASASVPTGDADGKEPPNDQGTGEKKADTEKPPLKKQSSKEKLTSKDTKPKERKSRTRSRSPHRSSDHRPRGSHRPPIAQRSAPRPPIHHRPIMSRPPPIRYTQDTRRTMYQNSLARAAALRDQVAKRREREERDREARERQKEIDARVRQKEKEFRQREEQLRLEQEIARLKYEKEKLEREKLEREQMKLRTAYSSRDRMPPPVPSIGMKRSYEGFSYGPDSKRGSYGGYGSRGSGRERTPPRREVYGSRDVSRSAGHRYGSDSGRRTPERRPPSSSGHRSAGYRDEGYHSQSGSRPSGRTSSSRRDSSPPRRSRNTPPPSSRGAPVWTGSGGGSSRHHHSSSRDHRDNYGSSGRPSGANNYGSGTSRGYPQQSTSGHGASPWGTPTAMPNLNTVGAWARPGPSTPVGSSMWIPQNVYTGPITPSSATSYNTSGERFDNYSKPYSGSSRRY